MIEFKPMEREPKTRTDDVWFRVSDTKYSRGVDQFDNPLPGCISKMVVMEYPVVRYTPKGAWLWVNDRERFVRLDARKRFACPTLREALVSFIARKQRQVGIYRANIEHCREVTLQACKALDEEAARATA
jgi:hypothetical protein